MKKSYCLTHRYCSALTSASPQLITPTLESKQGDNDLTKKGKRKTKEGPEQFGATSMQTDESS